MPAGTRKRVLFVDYWTRAVASHFAPIAQRLERDGLECLVLHFGSARKRGVPAYENVGGLPCYDFRFFESRDLTYMIRQVSPDIVVLLNCRHLFDRALIRAARFLGVTTVFIQHGLEVLPYSTDIKQTAGQKFRGVRYLRALWGYPRELLDMYLRVLARTDPVFILRRNTWSSLIRLLTSPAEFVYSPRPDPDICCDWALVYGEHSREIYLRHGYPPDRIVIVGNPFLDETFRQAGTQPSEQAKRAWRERLRLDPERRTVLYLTTPYVESNLAGWTHKSRCLLNEMLHHVILALDLNLVVKTHPGEDAASYMAIYRSKPNVALISGGYDVLELVRYADVVVGHESTALMQAVVLRKPLLLLTWVNSCLSFDYSKYGVAAKCSSVAEFRKRLKEAVAGQWVLNDACYREFIRLFAGFEDGSAFDRIASFIRGVGRTSLAGTNVGES